MYPYDYFALTIKTDFAICLESDVVPAPCDDVIDQMTPVAKAATDDACDSFVAHWEEETEAVGYYLDVATDSGFTAFVAGFQNLDVGNVLEYKVTGLTGGTTYYYRVRCYDDTDTSANSNIISVRALFDDWFLPTRDELLAMYTELHAHGVGGFQNDATGYWASYEHNVLNTAAYYVAFNVGLATSGQKSSLRHVRACHSFVAVDGAYTLRDTGPAGGLIFAIVGGTTYYEAAISDQSLGYIWSNINNAFSGALATAIGTGTANTALIIAQAGHIDSAAKLCDDLVL